MNAFRGGPGARSSRPETQTFIRQVGGQDLAYRLNLPSTCLGNYLIDVAFDRADRHDHPLRHIAIAQTLAQQQHNLPLAIRQRTWRSRRTDSLVPALKRHQLMTACKR